ncbi:MAG: hypothetical protein VB934_10925 [Polyangiaceae bacterium]
MTHFLSFRPPRLVNVSLAALLWLCVVVAGGCSRSASGSPEAVADAFADSYFRQANQKKALAFTAFGARKMVERELADVVDVRGEDYSPSGAGLVVAARRGKRSTRAERVRFDYTLSYPGVKGRAEKHVDIELAKVHAEWKVVRVTMSP